MVWEVIVPSLREAERAKMPGRGELLRVESPLFTRLRFSPRRGERSVMVPKATRSKSSSSSKGVLFLTKVSLSLRDPEGWEKRGTRRSTLRRAWANLKATPTPERPLKG